MRRFFSRIVFSLLAAVLILPVSAQDTGLVSYVWADAGLTLAYPAGWDEPVTGVGNDGRLTLQIVQTLSASPETRPPGVPLINISLLPNPAQVDDLTPFISDDLISLGLTPGVGVPAALLGLDAQAVEGVSEDGLLFGLSRAVSMADGQVLLVTGRAPEAQRDLFTGLFNSVADSFSLDVSGSSARPIYGVLWNTTRTGADGESAFVTLAGAAYGSDRIYAFDIALGVVEFDIATGAVVANYPNPGFQQPASIAVDSQDVVYVADTVCQCIHVLGADRVWEEPITGFEPQSPESIAVSSDGTLYATELTPAGIQVRLFSGAAEDTIIFGPEVVAQPLLGLDNDGAVIALTQDGAALLVTDQDLAPLAQLNIFSWFVEDFAIDAGGNYVLATDGVGIVVISPEGEVLESLGRIVANFPLPGEFVHPRGVVTGADGTIYIVDSDGTFGAVTALNTSVSAGRIGSTVLIPGVAVQGALDAAATQQDWTLNGVAGQVVTISAVDASGTGALDVGLELIAPDGTTEASNDDHLGTDLTVRVDAQIADHILTTDGAYTVRVMLIGGEGIYRLGIVQQLTFLLGSDGITELHGSIESALPKQRWIFEGRVGQVFTITMQATSGTLDPLLRLYAPDGLLLAENDDAADVQAMGKNSQIVQVSLPADGLYTLEAARFDGQGDYSLVIVVTS